MTACVWVTITHFKPDGSKDRTINTGCSLARTDQAILKWAKKKYGGTGRYDIRMNRAGMIATHSFNK